MIQKTGRDTNTEILEHNHYILYVVDASRILKKGACVAV
jgi:hypothetical protein